MCVSFHSYVFVEKYLEEAVLWVPSPVFPNLKLVHTKHLDTHINL
jgi:hypothetical protein